MKPESVVLRFQTILISLQVRPVMSALRLASCGFSLCSQNLSLFFAVSV